MVLGQDHRENLLTADKAQEGKLGTCHELLDNDFSVAVLVVEEHILEGSLGFFEVLGNHDSLAGGKAVVFEHDREGAATDMVKGLAVILESLVGCSWHLVFLHQSLCEVLAGLDGRGGLGGTENRLSGGSEQIDDSR